MKSIVFICPYFGTLPKSQFPLWLKSCALNEDVCWKVITDDRTEYNYPSNVKVLYTSFEDLKSQIQNMFSFTICLDNPYKLCDYKSAYGFIFKELVDGFDFWGHCDISDCIFGNIRTFITDGLLNKYDKLGFLGHMTLYRNTNIVNQRIFDRVDSPIGFNEVIKAKENKAFDESLKYGINAIYQQNKYKEVRVDSMYIDISPMYFAFHISSYDEDYVQKDLPNQHSVFDWNNGKLTHIYLQRNSIKRQELGYVHFQKRSMINNVPNNCNHFLIIPNGFMPYDHELTIPEILNLTRDRFYTKYWKLKWAALKYYTNKFLK